MAAPPGKGVIRRSEIGPPLAARRRPGDAHALPPIPRRPTLGAGRVAATGFVPRGGQPGMAGVGSGPDSESVPASMRAHTISASIHRQLARDRVHRPEPELARSAGLRSVVGILDAAISVPPLSDARVPAHAATAP